MAAQVYHAIGKRKTSVARVYVKKGEGKYSVNDKDFTSYFPKVFQPVVTKAFKTLGTKDSYDITMNVFGGGVSSQAEACMYGIARALTLVSEKNRSPLKKAGLMTRDARIVERKKYGHKKARKSFQFSKR
jgi:small subunit ribosomal protein S9